MIDASIDELITAAQGAAADDTAAMAAILRRFERMALAVARSVTRDAELQQDAAQGARLGLVRAVRSHTPGTPGFPSYARRYMTGEALRTLKSMTTPEIAVDPGDYAWPERPHDAATDTSFEVMDLIKVMTSAQQAVTKAHYFADLSFADIAVQLGISRPAVTQRFATIHRTLRSSFDGVLAA